MKKFIVLFAVVILQLSCSSNSGKSSGNNPPAPVTLKVSEPSGNAVSNDLSFPSVDQEDGAVNFVYSSTFDTALRMESAAAVTTGCDSAQVNVAYWWGEYDGKGTFQVANILTVGSQFTAFAGHNHSLMVIAKGLKGCTSFSISLVLRKVANN